MQTQTYKIFNELMESSSSSEYEPEVYKWLQIKDFFLILQILCSVQTDKYYQSVKNKIKLRNLASKASVGSGVCGGVFINWSVNLGEEKRETVNLVG